MSVKAGHSQQAWPRDRPPLPRKLANAWRSLGAGRPSLRRPAVVCCHLCPAVLAPGLGGGSDTATSAGAAGLPTAPRSSQNRLLTEGTAPSTLDRDSHLVGANRSDLSAWQSPGPVRRAGLVAEAFAPRRGSEGAV